jgi:hypothetical protein
MESQCVVKKAPEKALLERDDFLRIVIPLQLIGWSMIFPKTGMHFLGSCFRESGPIGRGRQAQALE